MKKIFSLIAVAVIAGGMLSFSLTAKPIVEKEVVQGPKWEKLGSRKVNMGADHDEIIVSAFEGSFTKLKFKVIDAPILVRNVKVVFGNGESKNVKVNRKFPAGAESRVIDLPGNKRVIKKVVMNYTTVAKHKGKAMVIVFGRH